MSGAAMVYAGCVTMQPSAGIGPGSLVMGMLDGRPMPLPTMAMPPGTTIGAGGWPGITPPDASGSDLVGGAPGGEPGGRPGGCSVAEVCWMGPGVGMPTGPPNGVSLSGDRELVGLPRSAVGPPPPRTTIHPVLA